MTEQPGSSLAPPSMTWLKLSAQVGGGAVATLTAQTVFIALFVAAGMLLLASPQRQGILDCGRFSPSE